MSLEKDPLGQMPPDIISPLRALNHSSVPWLVIEPASTRIMASNSAALDWLRSLEAGLEDKCLTDFVRTEDYSAISQLFEGAGSLAQNRIWTFCPNSSAPMQAVLMTLPLAGSETLLMVGIMDVTERERLRAERDQMLSRYEALAVQSQQYFWEWDLVAGTIRRSAGLMKSLGFEEPTTVQTVDWWQDRIHPADRDHILNSIFRAVEDKRLNWSAEYRFLKASGHYAHIYDQGILTLDQFGKPSRIIGSMFDITERRSAEIERDRFIESSPDLKAVLDASGNVIRANAAICELLGVASNEIQDQAFRRWIVAEDALIFDRLCTQLRIDEIRQTVTLRTIDNREISLNLSAYLPTGQIYITGADVTAERAERHQAHLIETAIQNSHDLTLITERLNSPEKTRITYVNPAIKEILGYAEDEVLGQSVGSFLADYQDEDKYRQISVRLLNREAFSEELPFWHRNGDTVWLEANIHPITDDSGAVTHAVLVARNITQRKLDQEAIQAANRELHSMLERIDDGFCALDQDFVLTYMNTRAESILRVKHADAINRKLWDVLPTLTTSEFYKPLLEAFHMQKATFTTGFSRRFQRYYDMRVYPSGNGLSLFMTDVHERVTAQQELENTRDILQDILDRSLDVIVTTDTEGVFHTVSKASAEIWGYEPRELIGRKMSEIVYQNASDEVLMLKAEPTFQIPAFENQYRHKDGRIVDMMWSASRSHESKLTVAIGRDITEANVIKRGLQAALEESERLAIEAQAASRAKSEFLRTISHELRTPMNGVLGMAQLLRGTNLDSRQSEYARILTESGTLLLGILNDILDLTQIEAGHITVNLQPVAIRSTVQSALETFQESARQKGLALEFESDVPEDARYMGDSLRIRQIVGNLVNNAIKFTASGGVRVRLEVRPMDIDISDVCIKVIDTGIGINPMYHERIFDRFFQIDMSATRIYGGSGLGLAICRKLTELMIGTLTVDSHEGGGSIFTLRIPLRRVTELEVNASARTQRTTEWGERPPVLIVEDKLINVQVLSEWLDRFGLPYEVVENGNDAMERIESVPYSAVLLDIQIPGIDGYEVARRVRQSELGSRRRLTIVAVTALARLEDRQRCFEAGVDE